MENRHQTDVTIIGAGPVGLFAVFQCGMLKMKCHVIDALEHIGGQCKALYAEKPIYDIPAWPEIMAGELIDQLEKQIAPFNPVYHLSQEARQMTRRGDGAFEITTSRGAIIESKAVIIAAGAGAFGPNKPPLDGIADYEGKSVFYMVKRRADFAGKKIAIAGGGDSAVDWALSLAGIAEKIYFIHRRDKFRAAPTSVDKLWELAQDGKVEMVIPYQLHALKGAGGLLSQVVVSDADGNERALDADALLPFFGLTPNLGPLLEWDVDVKN